MKHIIPSEKAYHETMVAVYDLMNKGEANLSAKELKTLTLGLRSSKLSEILSGKRKPDVPFLKAVYKLNVDPAFLLEHA